MNKGVLLQTHNKDPIKFKVSWPNNNGNHNYVLGNLKWRPAGINVKRFRTLMFIGFWFSNFDMLNCILEYVKVITQHNSVA